MCGGTLASVAANLKGRGLSPRVRGNPPAGVSVLRADRSIPACAGEPKTGTSLWCAARVYPRVCGGTNSLIADSPPVSGLSPRVRGNHPAPVQLRKRVGSIPACAGEPNVRPELLAQVGVYPRVCGGTNRSCEMATKAEGLSPRVRGNQPQATTSNPKGGSIPACAGEPSIAAVTSRGCEVYPRVCGGTRCASGVWTSA